MMIRGYKLFTGSAHPEFARGICNNLHINLSKANVGKFSNGEVNIKIQESVRGKDVFIIQPTGAPANDTLMELLIMVDAMRRGSAHTITAVMPLFGYARQDRKAEPRVPITAKLIANLLEKAGVDRIITLDLHAGQIQGFFDIPVDNLYGSILFEEYVKSKNFKNPVVASPDIGGVARARHFAGKLNLDMVIVDKRREKANESEIMNIIGDIKGKDIILIDDMIDTAGTVVKAAEVLKARGANSVMACATHPVLSGPAYDRIENGQLDELVVTDSIPLQKESSKIKVLSAAPLFAEVIKRIYSNESVNTLFN
ncbi:ribose-phosphate pyrophosphokinase [Thiovulum sp. ES]|nr:ribose-phosphate pyrophosphokinase [Thiovulum sp. ES]